MIVLSPNKTYRMRVTQPTCQGSRALWPVDTVLDIDGDDVYDGGRPIIRFERDKGAPNAFYIHTGSDPGLVVVVVTARAGRWELEQKFEFEVQAKSEPPDAFELDVVDCDA